MSRFEDEVDRLVRKSEDQQSQEGAARVAIEEAKPHAFNKFVEKAAEAAALLRSRGKGAEVSKNVVEYVPRRKWLSKQVVIETIVGRRISGWILHQATKTVDRGGPSYYYDPSWQAGIMVDTQGQLYRFKDDEATPLESFDAAVETTGATNAFTLERVHELEVFWERMVTQATARVLVSGPNSEGGA